VLYGAATGLPPWGNDFLVQGDAAPIEQFGETLAAGDFDGDKFADLAVGVPWENEFGGSGAGGVNVFYGSAGGLPAGSEYWSQETPGIPGDSETDDHFGRVLTAGDFDGDGYADLAVGLSESLEDDMGGLLANQSGAATVIYGSNSGLTSVGSQLFD